MKTTKYTFTFLLLSFVFFTTTFAQVAVIDNDNNILLQVNDYGSTGTVTLPPFAIFPTLPINNNMLLNFDGTLYFNGSALGTSNSAAGWTHSGTKIYNTTLTDNVGIGTNNPLSKLSVGGDGILNAIVFGETTDGYGIYGKATSTGNVINYGGYFTAEGTDGRAIFGSATGDNGKGVYGFSTGTNGMGIYGQAIGTSAFAGYFNGRGYFSGNVGLGTDNPLSKLSVGGEGSTDVTIYGTSASNGVVVYANSTALSGGTAVEAVSEGQNGTCIIAQTSSFGGNGVSAFAHGTNGRAIYGSAFGTNGKAVVGNGKAYDFDAVGTGVNYGATSSRRWKKNVIEIDNPLEKLTKLRGVYFDWDEEHGGLHDVGMIAEEVGKVFPEIVVYEENGIDADGMDYSKLTPLLVEVAKTQQKKIEELEKKLSKIESLLEGKRFTSVSNK